VLLVTSTFDGSPEATSDRDAGLAELMVGDGHGLLRIGALGLLASGVFAWFLATTNQLLPHDLAWLTIDESQLRALAQGRVVHFMRHDRAAFGGTLIGIAILYLWLIRVPLRAAAAWAWWAIALSSLVGFASFLTYLPTGYLDTWHGLATLALVPAFALGLLQAWRTMPGPRGPEVLALPGDRPERWTWAWLGRVLLLLTGFGMLVAGFTIATIGSVVVFVPQDLTFMGLDRATLEVIDPHLVPLIAHDRAGFGGGLATIGVAILVSVWCAPPSRSLRQALLLAGLAGFGAAIGIHLLVGYLDISHVGPAVLGAVVFGAGMAAAWQASRRPHGRSAAGTSPP
jgi:hypothetical protein